MFSRKLRAEAQRHGLNAPPRLARGCATCAGTSRSAAATNRPNGLWTAGSSEEKVVARGSDGREPFERVGACQTLARQTAPTALAPVPHLDGLVSFSPEPFELLQPLDVLGCEVTRGPAEPPRVLSHDVGEDVEDLADAKGAANEWRRGPALGSWATWRPSRGNRDVDDAAHLAVDFPRNVSPRGRRRPPRRRCAAP